MIRLRHRRDLTPNEIAERLTQLGCSVRDVSQGQGKGGSDLIVGLLGLTFEVECKSERGKLSVSQVEHYAGWHGAPLVVLNSAVEAVAWVQRVRTWIGEAGCKGGN